MDKRSVQKYDLIAGIKIELILVIVFCQGQNINHLYSCAIACMLTNFSVTSEFVIFSF